MLALAQQDGTVCGTVAWPPRAQGLKPFLPACWFRGSGLETLPAGLLVQGSGLETLPAGLLVPGFRVFRPARSCR